MKIVGFSRKKTATNIDTIVSTSNKVVLLLYIWNLLMVLRGIALFKMKIIQTIAMTRLLFHKSIQKPMKNCRI